MGSTLRNLAARADAAAEIEEGSVIVDLDPKLIDDSFIADRVADANDPTLAGLVESIDGSGQQVPILVRPNPGVLGRFQIAYGRRRTSAALILGRPVRAVVRSLSDDELVVAQGKENLERRDLSYIERAFFALRLERHGFRRETIMSAMGIGKGDLSTLIAVARTVPEDVVQAIGPAPAAGRPRWMLLTDQIKSARACEISKVIGDPLFRPSRPTSASLRYWKLSDPKRRRRLNRRSGWMSKGAGSRASSAVAVGSFYRSMRSSSQNLALRCLIDFLRSSQLSGMAGPNSTNNGNGKD